MSKSQINKITEKWEKSGLLDQLSTEKKTKCALLLEDVAELLIKNLDELKKKKFRFVRYTTEDVAATLLPIARRLFDESSVIPTAKALYNHYINFLCGDPEAFFVDAYTKDYARQLNQKKK